MGRLVTIVVVLVMVVVMLVVMVVLTFEYDDRTETCLANSSCDSSFGWIRLSTSSTEASFTFSDFAF